MEPVADPGWHVGRVGCHGTRLPGMVRPGRAGYRGRHSIGRHVPIGGGAGGGALRAWRNGERAGFRSRPFWGVEVRLSRHSGPRSREHGRCRAPAHPPDAHRGAAKKMITGRDHHHRDRGQDAASRRLRSWWAPTTRWGWTVETGQGSLRWYRSSRGNSLPTCRWPGTSTSKGPSASCPRYRRRVASSRPRLRAVRPGSRRAR